MNTGNLGLFEDQQFRADLHEAWGYVRRIHANTHYGRTYRQLVRGMVPVAIQDAVAANCGNTWSWRDCSIGAIPGAGEALAAIAARADVREAFRLHNRELRTYQRDLRAVLNRIDTFILEYGGNR